MPAPDTTNLRKSRNSLVIQPRREKCTGERGAVAGEYALLLAMLSVALVVAVAMLTSAIIRTLEAMIAILP